MGITKIGIVFLSISVLVSFGLTSNQAFAAGHNIPVTCADCDLFADLFFDDCLKLGNPQAQCEEELFDFLSECHNLFCPAVGGEFIGIDTTAVLVAGTQTTAAWMIPVIVSAIGIGIVIARKF